MYIYIATGVHTQAHKEFERLVILCSVSDTCWTLCSSSCSRDALLLATPLSCSSCSITLVSWSHLLLLERGREGGGKREGRERGREERVREGKGGREKDRESRGGKRERGKGGREKDREKGDGGRGEGERGREGEKERGRGRGRGIGELVYMFMAMSIYVWRAT